MNIKNSIKQIIPETLYNKYMLCKYENNIHKNYSTIEKEINERYKNTFGRDINWENPKTYNEKLNIMKIYGATELKAKLTDKFLVRDWIKEKIGEEYLIPLIGVYDTFNDIDFEKLPERFVMKCNHDSGSVVICNNKNELNLKKLRKKYAYYLKRNFAGLSYEMHYKDIKPKIIIEKYMGDDIRDYKFLCFDGNAYYCRVDFDRFGNHTRNIYDLDWKLQDFNKGNYKNYEKEIMPPKHFEEMKNLVSKLCQGFDQVRVDLYEVDDRVYFGEMTFTNGEGFEIFVPDEYDYKIGEKWNFKNPRKKV